MEIKLQVDKLSDKAYEILKEKILTKQLPPGTRLVDAQLAKQFGISRTPLRDAIRMLSEDGLVTKSAGQGFCVFRPTKTDICEIFEIRLMMESAVAGKLIGEILPNNKEAYAVIQRLYQQFSKETTEGNFVDADEYFHDKLVSLAGNARLYASYEEIRDQTRIFRRRCLAEQDRVAKAGRQHARICEGLLELDLAATVRAISDHIYQCRDDALRDVVQ